MTSSNVACQASSSPNEEHSLSEASGDFTADENEEDQVACRCYKIGAAGPNKGRGLFATQDIAPRTLLHAAPCLHITKEEYENHMKHTILEHYLFNGPGGSKLLALGDGSLFNHSRHPNVDYRVDAANLYIRYLSGHKAILKNEELCISYGANLWFEDANGDDISTSSDEEGFLSRIDCDDS